MTEKWERCRMCGLEWPAGALVECPQYRNAEHRRHRTNNRGRDVLAFDGPGLPEAAAPLPEPDSWSADEAGSKTAIEFLKAERDDDEPDADH